MFSTVFFSLYRHLLFPLLMFAMKAAARFSGENNKIREGLKLRARDDSGTWPWLACTKGQRPVWIHCASMEFEYAKPVITALKARFPDLKIMVTYFSPTVAQAARRFPGVDFACPMPWDRPAIWREFLCHHEPRALLLARTDTWPEMLRQTREHGIPSLLFSATLAAESGRARGLGRLMSRIVFSDLTEIFCVSKEDKEVFDSLGLQPTTHVRIAGDTRYDQVQARLSKPKSIKQNLFLTMPTPTLVAGSTWSEDESVLLNVIQSMQKGHERVRFVLVPHEPTAAHLTELEDRLQTFGLRSVRYSSASTWEANTVLIIDQIGILAELYAQGTYAFVGGSYRKTVHSVMEPLAAGCLTFVGPLHSNNREALEFATQALRPGSHLTMVQPARDADEFQRHLEHALAEFDASARASIQEEIRRRSGKTELVVQWLIERALSKN